MKQGGSKILQREIPKYMNGIHYNILTMKGNSNWLLKNALPHIRFKENPTLSVKKPTPQIDTE